MNFLKTTIIVIFMLVNIIINVDAMDTGALVVAEASTSSSGGLGPLGHYSFYKMNGEGFDPFSGEKNWIFVRNNPDKVWEYQGSKEYADLLKQLPENYSNKIGAKEWATLKNIDVDEVRLNSHGFGENGELNQLYMLKNRHKTDRGEPIMWNSYIGKLYADYLYNTNPKKNQILGVTDWLRIQYDEALNFWVVF